MSFVYPIGTLSANGVDYPIYGEMEAADAYLYASITAASWVAASDDTKVQGSVGAARWLDSLSWLGDMADPTNAHAWPRTGINGVDPTIIPNGVVIASFELAAGLVEDPELYTSMNDPMTKTITAGAVSETVFRPQETQWLGPVPKAVMAYLSPYLSYDSNAGGGPQISGADHKNQLEEDYDFVHGI